MVSEDRFANARRQAPLLCQPSTEQAVRDPEVLFFGALEDQFGQVESERLSPLTTTAVRLVLLTGQRIQEILRTQWGQLDFDENTWSFPRSQTKTKRPHLLPITPMIANALENLPKIGDMAFPNARRSDTPMPYETVSAAVREICLTHDIEPFSPRDLRRTCTTHWARIGIQPSTRQLLQNRSLNSIEERHYNIFDGLPEKRLALEKWERELARIFDGKSDSKVVNIRSS